MSSSLNVSRIDSAWFALQDMLQWNLTQLTKTRILLEKFLKMNPLSLNNLNIEIFGSYYSKKEQDFFSNLIFEFKSFKEINYTKYLTQLSQVNARAISLQNEEYPRKLSRLSNAPFMIFCRGDLFDFTNSIAIVGRRDPSSLAKKTVYELSKKLAKLKYKIVSGLALGIDAEAHRGCIDGRGLTAAVLGSPITQISPKKNHEIADEILKSGCIISERITFRATDSNRIRGSFSLRNRIISALSDLVIVGESNENGGTIKQIEYAVSQNKSILYFVPNLDHENHNVAVKVINRYGKKIIPFYSIDEGIRLVQAFFKGKQEIQKFKENGKNSESENNQSNLLEYFT